MIDQIGTYRDATGSIQQLSGATLFGAGGIITPPPCPNLAYVRSTSSAGDNGVTVRIGGTYLFSIDGINKAAYDICLRIYNTIAPTSPDVTATTPIFRLGCAAGQPIKFQWPVGFQLPSGFGIALTKSFSAVAAETSGTGVQVGDVVALNFAYA